jgi:hypothetical protein
MHIEGLKINAAAIGAGLYDIIEQRDQAALVAFGMLPADLMNMLKQQLCDKFTTLAKAQGAELPADELKELVRDTEHQVAVAIYAEASRKGKMIV